MHTTVTTTELNAKCFPYIIEAIDADGYDLTPQTDAEKLQFLFDTFHAEAGWNIERNRGNAIKTFAEWCQGLPSSFNIAWTNYDIEMLAKSWGSLAEDAKDREVLKVVDNYWNFIANKTFQLFKKHGITA